ncbi:N-acetylmuramic acid 6-phosphate etherase [Rathayibacter soli]|uniref:N-acetylmuramic acid 6-phosphate etherase n=1 Tax=Rathayibacter soli TaxID=3144168 RepID=UPI0027E58D94|nr:N-acetylmuramic acid 6-phosphate etherase [Glaciibacter superstes]
MVESPERHEEQREEQREEQSGSQRGGHAGERRDALLAQLGELSTEQVGDEQLQLDLMSVAELVDTMNRANETVPAVVAAAAPAITRAIDGIVERMQRGGRLIYVGAGTAGRMGVLAASEIPPTFGTDPTLVVGVIAGGADAIGSAVENAEDNVGAAVADLTVLSLTADDALVGISASGRTPYVRSALAYGRSLGAFTVAHACNTNSEIGQVAEVAIETAVGPEFLTGSTRLGSGTAQKLVVNMISTIVMVRLGKVYGSLMVDLKATNEKLRARSQRTVMLASGVDGATAARALAEVDGWVKAAIVVAVTGLSGPDAIQLLSEHGGMLRAALAAAVVE